MIVNSLYNKRLMEADYRPEITAYYFREWKNFAMDAQHIHDRAEIMYVISGQSMIEVENEKIEFKKGDFILIDAGVSHRLVVNENSQCRMLNVEFGFALKDNILPSIRELSMNIPEFAFLLKDGLTYYKLRDYEDIYPALKSLILELGMEKNLNSFCIELKFIDILVKISTIIKRQKESPTGNEHVNKCIYFINMNYDKQLQVKDISSHININEDYLNRIFKQYTGKTIIEYLSVVRVEKAKMLLLNTDIPIIDISDYIGINSRQYFSFIFKKHTGMSPKSFRNQIDVNRFE